MWIFIWWLLVERYCHGSLFIFYRWCIYSLFYFIYIVCFIYYNIPEREEVWCSGGEMKHSASAAKKSRTTHHTAWAYHTELHHHSDDLHIFYTKAYTQHYYKYESQFSNLTTHMLHPCYTWHIKPLSLSSFFFISNTTSITQIQ